MKRDQIRLQHAVAADSFRIDDQSVRNTVILSLLVCLAVQVWTSGDYTDLASSLWLASGVFVTVVACTNAKMARQSPVEVVVVWGHCLAMCYGPMLFKTLELRSVADGLTLPAETTCLAAQVQCLLVATARISNLIGNWWRRRSVPDSRPFESTLLIWSHTPILWSLTLVGMLSLIFRSAGDDAGVVDKIAHAASVLVYLPLLILGKPIFLRVHERNASKTSFALLSLYFLCLVIIGLLKNSRGLFMALILSVAILLWLKLLADGFVMRRGRTPVLVILVFMGFMGYLFVERLSSAMLLARESRSSQSPLQTVLATARYFQDSNAIEALKRSRIDARLNDEYEEVYVAGTLLSRLVMLKFMDNSLALARVQSGEYSEILKEVAFEKFLSLAPGPILRFVRIEIEKSELEFSTGDLMNNLELGKPLGGRIVGASVPHAISMFGPWVGKLLIVPLLLLSFGVLKLFMFRHSGRSYLSPAMVITLPSLFYLAVGDSFFDPLNYIFRQLPQTLLILYSGALIMVSVAKKE